MVKRVALAASATVVVVLVIVLASLQSSRYQTYFRTLIETEARRSGVQLSLGEFVAQPWALRAASATVFIPRQFLGLSLSDLRIVPVWSSLLRFDPALRIRSNLYEGRLDARLQPGEALRVSVQLTELALQHHPQLAGLGIESGFLDLTCDGLVITGRRWAEGRCQLGIRGLQKPRPTPLAPTLTKLPLTITVPPIASLDLTLHALPSPNGIQIEQLHLTSSLGELQSEKLSIAGYQLAGRLSATLTTHGEEVLGGYLPLVSGGTLTATDRAFTCEFVPTSVQPRCATTR